MLELLLLHVSTNLLVKLLHVLQIYSRKTDHISSISPETVDHSFSPVIKKIIRFKDNMGPEFESLYLHNKLQMYVFKDFNLTLIYLHSSLRNHLYSKDMKLSEDSWINLGCTCTYSCNITVHAHTEISINLPIIKVNIIKHAPTNLISLFFPLSVLRYVCSSSD